MTVLRRFAIVSLGALLISTPAVAQNTARTPAPAMESLVKQLGEAYKTSTSGGQTWYVISIVSDGKGANIGLNETRDWLGNAGLAKGRVETMIIALKAPATPQLLKAVAKFNVGLSFGGITVDDGGLYYTHDFVLNGLTAENLGTEVMVAYFIAQSAKKEFAAYVE